MVCDHAGTSDGIDRIVFDYTAGKQYCFFSVTLDHYVRFFTDADFLIILWRSLWIAVKTTMICLLIGYPAAYYISRCRERLQNILVLCITIPMWINMLVRTYAWIGLLSEGGLVQKFLGIFGMGNTELLYTEGAVLLGMVYNFLPFMILQINTALCKMDDSLLEAAADLGANPVQTFRRVTLPLSVPGVINGITLVFLPAVSSFFIPKLLGGGKYFPDWQCNRESVYYGWRMELWQRNFHDHGSNHDAAYDVRAQGGNAQPGWKGGRVAAMKKGKRPAGKLLMVLMIAFFYLPILYMIVFSFNDGKSLTSFSGFSLRWYQHMLESGDMMEALYTTFSVALIATFVSTVAGTISAIGLSKSRKLVRDLMQQVDNLPMMNPEIVTAIGFMLLFITFRVEKGYMTMLLAHIAFCIPYVILSVMPKIRSLDPNLADAAMDLGATPWQALIKVIVPQITPGIISGALIAFTMSVDDFIISYFVTGGGVKNLSIMVYTMSKRVNPSINAVSTLMIVIITIVLVVINVAPLFMAKRQMKDELKKRRVLIPAAMVCVCAAGLAVFFRFGHVQDKRPFEGETLHIYNWGEYTGENILANFEEETGAKVVMENFDSNEQMYIKVANGEAYDIVVPSDYMIQRLISEEYLQKLDWSKLDCMDKLADAVKGLPYDPDNEYSVPYFWGTVGIVYDKTKVDMEDLKREGYNIFLDEKYRGDIYLYDSERDSFMMALKALGYSMNTENQDELEEAYEWLVKCVQTMKPEIVTDEIIDNMAQGRKALGLIYSGDATYVMDENGNMGYYLPETGTNLWSDAMVIPKNAKNPELAHAFINYATDYEGAYDNSSYVGYTSANQEVMDELSGEGGDFEGINAYIPRSGNELDEVFVYNERTRKEISNLWSRVKIAASNAN